MSAAERCPCGAGGYAACCGSWHNGAPAPDALRLMRSRYSAYVLGLDDYLLATWHASTRPARLDHAGPTPRWLGLTVTAHQPDGERATVEFVARYRVAGRGRRLHEVSRFVLEAGRWYYLDGVVG